jgi:DNA replication protein DnaD
LSKEAQGWVSIHRGIQSHWLWEDRPFSKGQAWVDLILLANHQDKTILFDGKPESVRRGSFLTSTSRLMKRWGWGNRKVLNFLSQLEKEGMLVRSPRKRCTGITLVNYERYQSGAHPSRTDGIPECDPNPHQDCTGTNSENTGISGDCDCKSASIVHQSRTNSCTQTINPNNENNRVVPALGTHKENVPVSQDLLASIQKLKPGESVESELQSMRSKGVSDALIRWAVDKAVKKGKQWNYARGILMNCMQQGKLDIPPDKRRDIPSKAEKGFAPSYDISELEERGLHIPNFEVEMVKEARSFSGEKRNCGTT